MIEAYLQTVRRGLRGLPEAEAGEIVAELRIHLEEQAAAFGEAQALAALGDPGKLADLYLAEQVVAEVERNPRPWSVPWAVWRLARLGAGALVTLLVSAAGYTLGLVFVAAGLLKPFMADRIGLWRIADPDGDFSISFGRAQSPPGAELLGWWLVPLALVAGAVLLVLTWRYGRRRIRRLGRARAALFTEGRNL